jgi:hypothetical protein
MATIKYGHLISEARGKMNGTVFSRNTYGGYMRAKVSPIQPRTPAQQAVRQSMASIASSWRNLTDDQRAAWNALAQQVTRINVFGDNLPLTGFNLYGRLNRTLDQVGASRLTDAPQLVVPDAPTIDSITATASPLSISIEFSPDPVPADHALIVRASTDLSAGISYAKGKIRQVQVVAAAGTSPVDIATAWQAKYGGAVAGNKVFIEILLVNTQTGFSSQVSSGSAIFS